MSLSWDLQVFETLSSTQDECKKLAQDGAAEGSVVQALSQSEGKGRHGRAWESGEDNLTLSFILRPDIETRHIGQFSILMGAALVRAIGECATLKWPNDVLIDDQKCAGVLIDSDLNGSRVNWLVVGVGVNTSSAPAGAAVLDLDRDTFRDQLLEEVDHFYSLFQEEGFAPVREAWLGNTLPKGTALNIGTLEDLDVDGNLVVRDAQNRLKTYSSGDVFLKDTHYAAGD